MNSVSTDGGGSKPELPPPPSAVSPPMVKEDEMKKLEVMLQLGVDPVEGLGSKWDYENNKWK